MVGFAEEVGFVKKLEVRKKLEEVGSTEEVGRSWKCGLLEESECGQTDASHCARPDNHIVAVRWRHRLVATICTCMGSDIQRSNIFNEVI